jgi:hypothetical protein
MATLRIKLVPLPFGTITSLTAVEPSGTQLAAGYVLSQQRLFRFWAESLNRWLSEEVQLREAGEPLALWSEGVASRLGFRDGRVLSLPARVPLAGALPGPQPEVRAFASACGQAYALSAEGGLYRLARRGEEPQGAWEPVPLAGVAGAPAWPGSTQGVLLLGEGDGVLVATRDGGLLRVEEPLCPR